MDGKMSIGRRIFFLLLLTGLVCFAAFEAVSFFGLYGVQQHAMERGNEMGTSAAAFAEEVADEQAKKRVALLAEEKARHIDAELARLKEDTELLAMGMTRILTHRELYLPRSLPVGGETPIASGEPYLFILPSSRENGLVPEILPDAGIAANAADILSLWVENYDKDHQMTCFYVSEAGYIISVDLMPQGLETVEFYEEWFSPSFDPRERSWYKETKATGKIVFTDIYIGVEGYPAISCVAPYYDGDGFAGMAGISHNIESLYRQIEESGLGEEKRVNFILNRDGEVILSSEKEGLLAASATPVDLRRSAERELAEEAACMVQGLSGVDLVTVGGKGYYLAYAPIPGMGWSFGTLLDRDVVVQPARDAKAHLLARAEDFSSSLRAFFWENLLRTAAMLFALLLVLYVIGQKASDRFVRPILALTAGVRDIAGGNFDRKLSIQTGDEIETLADSFNQMTDELQSYIKNLAKTATEKERIETELSVAARIQSGILPKDLPARKEFELVATMQPAKEVGGDFYDFYFLDERHLMVTVADVSDKGVPAALFMVAAKTILKDCAVALGSADKLREIAALTNDRLAESNDEGMFVTVFTGVLDITTGEFVYANAGHNPPLARRGGKFEFLPVAQGPMLGVVEGMEFPTERLTLAPGDLLFLYTDGVTEAMNAGQEIFTEERLRDTLSAQPGRESARAVLAAVKAAVDIHADGAEPSDDITMLGLAYHGPG